MTDIAFDILPQRSALLENQRTGLHALLRVQAPTRPAGLGDERVPLNLALVLDRSGSMSGRPLEEAKRCAAFIVDRLDARDRLALVVYDNRVEVIAPSAPVIDKPSLQHAIASIYSGGSTALFDGWEAGAGQCLAGASGSVLSRVLLLSDGCANHGLTDADEISRRCAALVEAGVSTSTYGLGQHFNEELMVAMARTGGGQGYYGESAQELLDPFQEEFALLSSLCARRLKLSLCAPAGVEVELLNDYPVQADGSWLLPELAWDGEAWALVKLTVPAELAPAQPGLDTEVLRAFVSYTDVATPAPDTRSAALRLPRVHTDAWAAMPEDVRVTARRQEVRVAQLQRDIRAAAMRGDWAAVDAVIGQAEHEAKDNAWVEAALESLKRYARERDAQRIAKEALYSSRRMMFRLAERDEIACDYSVLGESVKAEYLRRKREQGKRLDGG